MRLLCVLALVTACGRWGFGDDPRSDSTNVDAYVPIDVPAGAITAFEVAPPPFSTTSTTFVDIPGGTFMVPASNGTTWLMLVSATLASTNIVAFCVEAQYTIDGIERGMGGSQGEGAGPWQHYYVFAGTDSPQTVAFQLRDASGGTATLDQLRVVLVPLPANAEPHYTSMDAVQTVQGTVMNPLDIPMSLGAMSGDYLVILLVNSSDFPTQSDIYVEWIGPAGEPLLRSTQNARESWQSVLMFHVMAVASANATFTLRISTGTGQEMGQLRNIRVFAMRPDAFASVDHVWTATTISTASSNVSTGPSLAPVGNAARFVHFATTLSHDDCGNTAPALRRLHFVVDGVDRVTTHATANCALELTYGVAGLLGSRPAAVSNGTSSANGQTVLMLDSHIVLLGLP